jgi:CRISPR-associated protein Cmr3
MNLLLLQPTDILFFRDGRPMGGSLGGHGAGWPLPTVTNAALHAALHRADLETALGSKIHGHDHHGRNGHRVTDVRKFGSLLTAGPFPVLKLEDGAKWIFPRPLDAGVIGDGHEGASATLRPLAVGFSSEQSSLPRPLRYAVANENGPTKKMPAPWWNAAAWEIYLGTSGGDGCPSFHTDNVFADTEFSYGIGIDPVTGAQDGRRFYSAHYLRLRPEARIGVIAAAQDKVNGDAGTRRDLIPALFPNSGSSTPVIVGGQQRWCTVEAVHNAPLPLPKGKRDGFYKVTVDGRDEWLLKWVLLAPAIWPCLPGDAARGINGHRGGWLPNWIAETCQGFDEETVEAGSVLLLDGPGKEKAKRKGKGVVPGKRIRATLVAAVIGKPISVSGYSLAHEAADRQHGEAKPTHLAVPAGSVFYFTCASETDARKLAAALNWHGDGDDSTIRNRRSTLMGEKGFGIGVCGTWDFHDGQRPAEAVEG